MTKATTPIDLKVYRNINPQVLGKLKVGDTFSDKGFVSTSLSKEAINYHNSHKLEMLVPKGSKAVYVVPVSVHNKEGEEEVVLNRNSKFRVVAVDADGMPSTVELIN